MLEILSVVSQNTCYWWQHYCWLDVFKFAKIFSYFSEFFRFQIVFEDEAYKYHDNTSPCWRKVDCFDGWTFFCLICMCEWLQVVHVSCSFRAGVTLMENSADIGIIKYNFLFLHWQFIYSYIFYTCCSMYFPSRGINSWKGWGFMYLGGALVCWCQSLTVSVFSLGSLGGGSCVVQSSRRTRKEGGRVGGAEYLFFNLIYNQKTITALWLLH